MTRNRDISIEDFAQEDDEHVDLSTLDMAEEGPIPDLRADGFGHCWLDDTRTCTRRCMAFNNSQVAEGEASCMIVQGIQQATEPALIAKEQAVAVLSQLSRSMDDNTRVLSTLVQTVQQLMSRVR